MSLRLLLPLLLVSLGVPLLYGTAFTAMPRQPEPVYLNDPSWQLARQEVDKSTMAILAQHQAEMARGINYYKIIRGNTKKRQIALTFDDGPHPAFTPKLLALLRKEGVKATFFVVGEMAQRYPNLVRAEIADGHCVGNHTYHHVNLTKIPEQDVATEIKACNDVIKQITGHTPRLFRPPGGDYDKGVIEAAESMGYTTVLWTDDPGDYASPGEKLITSRILKHVSNGGIILIHDGIEQTYDILPELIHTLKKEGYTFVTVDEMMKDQYIAQAKLVAKPMIRHTAPWPK